MAHSFSELIALDSIYPKFKIKNKENDRVNDKILQGNVIPILIDCSSPV